VASPCFWQEQLANPSAISRIGSIDRNLGMAGLVGVCSEQPALCIRSQRIAAFLVWIEPVSDQLLFCWRKRSMKRVGGNLIPEKMSSWSCPCLAIGSTHAP
jgi:hypothetical protein